MKFLALVVAATMFPAPFNSAQDDIKVVLGGVGLPVRFEDTEHGFRLSDSGGVALSSDDLNNGESEHTVTLATGEIVKLFVQKRKPLDRTYAELFSEDTHAGELVSYVADSAPVTKQGVVDMSSANLDTSDLVPNSAFAVGRNWAMFALENGVSDSPISFDSHSVYVDGEPIVEGAAEDVIALTNLQPGREYEVVIESRGVERSVDGGSPFELTKIRATRISPTTSESLSASSAPGYAPGEHPAQGFLHTTFIKENFLDADILQKIACSLDHPGGKVQFAGDGRDFQVPGKNAPWEMGSYRTFTYIEAGFTSPEGFKLRHFVRVSPTKRYLNGKYLDTRTASADKVTFTNISASDTYAQVVINHDVGNPFCKLLEQQVGAITYHDEVRFYRNSNTIELTGWRFPAPHHEISFKFSIKESPGMYYLPVYFAENKGFICLLGELKCQRDNYRYTKKGR